MISPARVAAFRILRAVDQGGWASDLLRDTSLETRDAALASEIVFGVLRRRLQLDWIISQAARRPIDRLDPEVAIALRMGVYQLHHLDRVPRHAVVNESVNLVKQARKRSATAFVNAVLRNVGEPPREWPDDATELSMPAWLLSRWQRAYGTEAAARIARSFLLPPDKFVRIVGDPPPGVTLEPTAVGGCFRVTGGSTGGLRLQDIGSQAIVPLLDLRPGLTLLDLCAAPGGKTAQALEHGVRVVASDLHPSRLRELRDLPCDLVVLDATRPLPFRRRFDRILVDAPCSGTGTLGRNPEIRWRIQEKDLIDLHVKQVAMLRSALEMLAPGGLLVYSTCSLEAEENEDVISEAAGGRAARLWRRLPGSDSGDGFFAAVIPSGVNPANG